MESIGRIITAIETVQRRALLEQPGAYDLHTAAAEVHDAAKRAARRIRGMDSPFSIPRLRLYLTLATLLILSGWTYFQYFEAHAIRVAVTKGDSAHLQERVRQSGVRSVRLVSVAGSADGLEQLTRGQVDATIVQGGMAIPDSLDQLALVRYEHVLYLRKRPRERDVAERVITFRPGQGSHVLGKLFYKHWGAQVMWLHAWAQICNGGPVPDADAVFVVVDPTDPQMQQGLERVVDAGFELTSPNLGAYEDHVGYLLWKSVRPGYYQVEPAVPAVTTPTYWVANYLVARSTLTALQRDDVTRALVLHSEGERVTTSVLHSDGDSVMADLANLFEGIVNFALIMAALLGLEIVLHRRYIQELGALLTNLSLIQAERDVLGIEDPEQRAQNVQFLELCGDLFGLISSIAGYYSQGNAALAFNSLTGLVHVRANLLKLNIQLKLVQAAQLGAR